MHKTIKLAKILKKGAGKESGGAAASIVLGILGALLAALLAVLGVYLNRMHSMIADPSVFFQELFLAGAIVSLIFLVPRILNTMYMSNDLPLLLTFPYTYNQIIGAKVLNVSSVAWIFCAIFSLPCQIAYGIVNGCGPAFFGAAVLAAVCVPILILSAIGSILVLIMPLVHTFRNKDTLKVIGGILLFALVIAIVLLPQIGNADSAMVAGVVSGLAKVVNILPINFALGSLMSGSGSGLMVLAIIGITAVCGVIFALLTKALYIKGTLSMQETSASGKTLTDQTLHKASGKRSVYRAYLMKELRLVRRNPAYLTNGFLYTFIYPAVLLIILMVSSGSVSMLSVSVLKTQMGTLGWVAGVVLVVTVVASGSNAIAASSMSREGAELMLLKQTPVDQKVVLKAKQGAALVVCGISVGLYVIVGGGILVCMGKMAFWGIPFGLVIGAGALVFCVNTVMLRDIKKPMFVWENEADMLKTRTGARCLILMFAGLFIGLALAIAIPLLPIAYFWPILLVLIALSVVILLLSNRRLYRVGPEIMRKY